MSKELIDRLKSYIPSGDGHNSQYANDLADAVAILEAKAVPVGEPDCDRSACGDFSPGPCDNPDCPALRSSNAAPVGEREAFEAHMRIGGYSNPDKHPDGSYVSSAMELWWQGWKARSAYQRAQQPQSAEAVALSVWYGPMPESNGKQNYTALLHRKGESLFDGVVITLDRSEYPDRVRYEADRVRHLIGELAEEPCITDYDADAHSGYVAPPTTTQPSAGVVVPHSLLIRVLEPITSEGYINAKHELLALMGEFARLNGKEVGRG